MGKFVIILSINTALLVIRRRLFSLTVATGFVGEEKGKFFLVFFFFYCCIALEQFLRFCSASVHLFLSKLWKLSLGLPPPTTTSNTTTHTLTHKMYAWMHTQPMHVGTSKFETKVTTSTPNKKTKSLNSWSAFVLFCLHEEKVFTFNLLWTSMCRCHTHITPEVSECLSQFLV